MGTFSPRVHGWPKNWNWLCLFSAFFSFAVSTERPRYQTAYACEGSTLMMECESGHVINLIRANYGRFSITICNEHGNTEWSVNCMSPRSHRVLHDKCSQRQHCNVAASTRGFGDPCPGTLKYLEAHFQCVPVNPPSFTPRPRPPWFLTTKTTPSMLDDTKFPSDQIDFKGNNVTDVIIVPSIKNSTSSSSTTTTTLRPPPWLFTNNTNGDVSISVTHPSTIHTTAATNSTTTTTTIIDNHFVISSDTDTTTSVNVNADFVMLNKSAEVTPVTSSATALTTTSAPQMLSITSTESGNEIGMDDSWCPPISARGLSWNWTRGGNVAVVPCPGGATGWARRPCDPLLWGGISADLSECRSMWLNTLTARAEASDAVLAISHDLSTVTGNRPLYGGDVTATARLINQLARRMALDITHFPDQSQREALVTELFGAVLAIVSHMISGVQQEAWADLRTEEFRAAMTAMLLGLEEVGFLLADNIYHQKSVSHMESNIVMRLQVLETRNIAPITFPSAGDAWVLLGEPYENLVPMHSEISNQAENKSLVSTLLTEDSLTLPPEALLENSENGFVKIVFFSYDGILHLFNPDQLLPLGVKSRNESRVLNSRIISASLGSGRHIQLPEPVTLIFKMIETENVYNPVCVFWDYISRAWSDEGCQVLQYNITHTKCSCSHLTNFAVLIDVNSMISMTVRHISSDVVTKAGCVVTIVFLTLVIVFLQVFKGIKCDRTTIHKNFYICLLMAEVFFIIGMTGIAKRIVCGIVAGFIHFFLLSSFAWMAIEGFQLYILLLELFTTIQSQIRWYYISGYVVPSLIVVVSAIVDPFSYGTEDSCWLRTDNYFVFAFGAPAIFLFLSNCILLLMSLVLIFKYKCSNSVMKNKEQIKLALIRSWLRGSVIVMILLGLTWTFGILYLIKNTVPMAYVFMLMNCLLGLFIFVFHCLHNEKLMSKFTSSFWKIGGHRKEVISPASSHTFPNTTTLPTNIGTTQSSNVVNVVQRNSINRSARFHSSSNTQQRAAARDDDEKYSCKPCGRDSGHGGSEQEDSPHSAAANRLTSLRLNRNVAKSHLSPDLAVCNNVAIVNSNSMPFISSIPESSLQDYRLFSDAHCGVRLPGLSTYISHRNHSPWNHTYTEIPEGVMAARIMTRCPDPVYEEIERGQQAEFQIGDFSDDGDNNRKEFSDISRQSSRSCSDNRPLLPFILLDRHSLENSQYPNAVSYKSLQKQQCIQNNDHMGYSHILAGRSRLENGLVSPSHSMSRHILHDNGQQRLSYNFSDGSVAPIVNHVPHYNEGLAYNQPPVVQPLSEPNLKNWEEAQRHRDLQQLHHLGEMTVAMLSGEQVVCKLKSPLTHTCESHPEQNLAKPSYLHN